MANDDKGEKLRMLLYCYPHVAQLAKRNLILMPKRGEDAKSGMQGAIHIAGGCSWIGEAN